jgi:hypothetical protein
MNKHSALAGDRSTPQMQHGFCHDKHVTASARVREAAARCVIRHAVDVHDLPGVPAARRMIALPALQLHGVSQDLIGAAEPGKLCGIAAFVRMLLQGSASSEKHMHQRGRGRGSRLES